MSAPERPPPPTVGKVNHHSIELYWEEAMKKAMENFTRADGRIRVTVQEEDRHASWANIYSGYSKKHICDNLEPWSQYRYRIRFQNNHGASEWSQSFVVSTTKEPMTGEHLHKAVLLQNLEMLEKVIESGDIQSVDMLDKYSFTPLMQAAQKGYDEFIEVLVKHGADVDFQNEAGKTAMMLASFAGRIQCVKELRHFGSRYDMQDRGGSTALHWAMDSKNLELIDWMCDDGANIECKDFNGWTPLLRVAAVGGNGDVTNLLLRNGACVNLVDKDGKTALMIAVVNGHQTMVEMMLKKGADITIKNEYGKNAYEMAISMERRRVSKVIEEFMEKNNMKSSYKSYA